MVNETGMNKKMTKKRNKKIWEVIFAAVLGCCLIFTFCGFSYNIFYGNNMFNFVKKTSLQYQVWKVGYITLYGDNTLWGENVEDIGVLTNDRSIEQTIFINRDMLYYDELVVAVRVATYQRKNPSKIYFEFEQKNGLRKTFEIDASVLQDNQMIELKIDTADAVVGNCKMRIYSDADRGDYAVTFYTVTETPFNRYVIIDGEKQRRNLLMKVYTPWYAKPRW